MMLKHLVPMTESNGSRCKFGPHCNRGSNTDSHRPSIGQAGGTGCPFPGPVADVGWNRGQSVFHQGDPVKGVYSLRSGLMALERVNEHGEMVVLKLLQPGAFFPCADLFADGIHSASARAIADSTACFIPAERLMSMLADNARLGLEMTRRGCEEARDNENIIFRLCSGDLTERVTALLESLGRDAAAPAADGSVTFVLPISWRDLSNMAGTSPEVMSRLLRRLSEAGRLRFSGRNVTLAGPEPDKAAG